MILSTKNKLVLLVAGSLILLAVGVGLFSMYSVKRTMLEEQRRSSVNTVALATFNVMDRYQILFRSKADQAVALHLLEHARHRGAADAEHTLHVALIHRPFLALDQYVVQRVALDARQSQRLHLRVDALAQLVEQQADPAAKVLFHAVSSLPRPMGNIVRKQTIF